MSAPAAGERRSLKGWLGIYARGAAMGMAELVPGVSGGTIAFVTGIYEELVNTFAGLSPAALVVFRDGPVMGLKRFWAERNLTFLLVLGLGMVTSVVLLAQALTLALATARPVVWAFFLGIIVLSVWMLGRALAPKSLLRAGPVGILLGVSLLWIEPFGGSASLPTIFVGGAIAVSAWLLPAVSGSYVLLILGLYEVVLAAVAAPGWEVLGVFLVGCAVGLLLFARMLSYALDRWRAPLLSLLTGFMVGASVKLWPWQVDGSLTGPSGYETLTGEPAYASLALIALLLGALVIWLLTRLEK